MLSIGEVCTGLLQHSAPVPSARATELLDLVAGEEVRRSERPIAHASSPSRLTGVDCRLLPGGGTRGRVVGTVSSRATITGGHVVQGSAFTEVHRSPVNFRLPWSHYLARPGRLELFGKADWDAFADGLLSNQPRADGLDVGTIANRAMDAVQQAPTLDRAAPFRMPRTRLRWVGQPGPADDSGRGATPTVHLAVHDTTLRTLRVRIDGVPLPQLVELCEDLALHDWLLTALLELTRRSDLGAAPRAEAVSRLRPAIDYLLHLWMPGARIAEEVAPLWAGLERRPGFSRQWASLVSRIRDQITLATLAEVTGQPTPSSR